MLVILQKLTLNVMKIVIIPDGHEQMGASDIRNAIMGYI